MSNKDNIVNYGISLKSIKKALSDGIFDEVYREISGKSGVIASSQARKILEEVRRIKDTRDKKEMKNRIVKILLILEYQNKRGIIESNVAEEYKKILSSALELTDSSDNPQQLGKNLYDLIEMLTIKFYKRD